MESKEVKLILLKEQKKGNNKKTKKCTDLPNTKKNEDAKSNLVNFQTGDASLEVYKWIYDNGLSHKRLNPNFANQFANLSNFILDVLFKAS